MKPLMLVLSFLPLIAFSLLARLLPSADVGVAGLVAAACAAIATVAVRPVWPPKILNASSLVLFTALAVAGFAGSAGTDRWLTTWAGAGVGVSRVAAAAIEHHTASGRLPDLLLGTAIPIVIILYMLKFSSSYPDRVTHAAA